MNRTDLNWTKYYTTLPRLPPHGIDCTTLPPMLCPLSPSIPWGSESYSSYWSWISRDSILYNGFRDFRVWAGFSQTGCPKFSIHRVKCAWAHFATPYNIETHMILLPNFQREFQTGNIPVALALDTLMMMDTVPSTRIVAALPVATFKHNVLIIITRAFLWRHRRWWRRSKSRTEEKFLRVIGDGYQLQFLRHCMVVWNIFVLGSSHRCHRE